MAFWMGRRQGPHPKLHCLGNLDALRSDCSRDSPLLRLSRPDCPALAALRVQANVVGRRYPQHMGFSILTHGVFGHYSSCNLCLPCASGEGCVQRSSDRHLIGKQRSSGLPPARFVQIARQPAQPKRAPQDRPVIGRDVRTMEHLRSRRCSN